MKDLNNNELSTILAALRYLSANTEEDERREIMPDTFAEHSPLNDDEINELCIKLNTPGDVYVGGFNVLDYQDQALEDGFEDLTDEQIKDLMMSSGRKFDAMVGMNWEVMSQHIAMWASDNNIEKPVNNSKES